MVVPGHHAASSRQEAVRFACPGVDMLPRYINQLYESYVTDLLRNDHISASWPPSTQGFLQTVSVQSRTNRLKIRLSSDRHYR